MLETWIMTEFIQFLIGIYAAAWHTLPERSHKLGIYELDTVGEPDKEVSAGYNFIYTEWNNMELDKPWNSKRGLYLYFGLGEGGRV